MDAEQVVGKILADANGQAAEIKKEADEKIAGEKAKLDEQLKEYKEQTNELAKKAAEDKKLRMQAAARMETAKKLLAEKSKIIDEVFEKAQQKLLELNDDDYLKLMEKLMLAAVETGDEEVLVDKNEKRIDQKLIERVNANLKGKGNLKMSGQRADIGGGFILKRGNIKNNVSLAVLIEQARKGLEIELAKELFAEQK